MKTINVRSLQKRIRHCVRASQKDRIVITRHGTPTALIIGVEGSDWETLALQTNPAFWRMIEKRRKEPSMPFETIRKLVQQ
jgi:prevent-host-death family protein